MSSKPADQSRLRRRPTPEKVSAPDSDTPAHSVPPHPTSGSASRIALGLVSIAFSAYFVYDKFVGTTDQGQAILSDSYALCSREGARPQIYTVDPENPRAQCLLVRHDKFLSAGSLGAFRHLIRPGAFKKLLISTLITRDRSRPIELARDVCWAARGSVPRAGPDCRPGAEWWVSLSFSAVQLLDLALSFSESLCSADSHTHVLEYGATKQMPLEGTSSIVGESPYLRISRLCRNIHYDMRSRNCRPSPSLHRGRSGHSQRQIQVCRRLGLGPHKVAARRMAYIRKPSFLSLTHTAESTPPQNALEADPVVAGRPVVLQSKDGHALWVSQAVLRAMEPIPDEVEGGVIVRDSFGRPTGTSPRLPHLLSRRAGHSS